MTKIDFHADDYALSENSDNDILTLCKQGKLDSISVIPNLAIFDKAAKKFLAAKKSFPKEVKACVHLNVMEGRCLADKDDLPDLVDKDGFFNVSWGNLFFASMNPLKRKKIRSQLKVEILAQIKQTTRAGLCEEKALRVDSHQHPHMIPVFFDALTDALDESGIKPEYIRNSQDPILCYMTAPTLFKTYSLANIIKCLILNHYSRKVRRWQKMNGLKTNLLCGVFFSGRMDSERVKKVLPRFVKKCEKTDSDLEVLFHPGTMLESELTEEFTKPGFNKFHLSEDRSVERKSLESPQL